jgi:hypothetical protein
MRRELTRALVQGKEQKLAAGPNLPAKSIQNVRRMAQKRAPKPFLMRLWVILCNPLLLFGQFFGYIHPSNGQFPGICLTKS